MADYKELTEFIVRNLVTNPDDVVVKVQEQEEGQFGVRISVAREDLGRVIGKKGATINALRQVVRASSQKEGQRVDVDVEEE
ncbi:MAG: KH domain-containing protein [Synergistales bacterium]|nr:KH domain-containing protein [Synergistales bacterium]